MPGQIEALVINDPGIPGVTIGMIGKVVSYFSNGVHQIRFDGMGDVLIHIIFLALQRITEQESKAESCSFCGEAVGAASSHNSGLRAQAEPWHVCYRPTCRGSIDLHTQRIEAGLFDTPETRAATRAWYVAKLEREEREARASRLAAMVQP